MLLVVLTPWHLLLLPAFGGLMITLSYAAHRFAPPPLAPQYILDMEDRQLLTGRETKAAEDAIIQLVKDVPEVTQRQSARTCINDEVLTAFNAYKSQCLETGDTPLGLSRWVYRFDPDLYKRVFGGSV